MSVNESAWGVSWERREVWDLTGMIGGHVECPFIGFYFKSWSSLRDHECCYSFGIPCFAASSCEYQTMCCSVHTTDPHFTSVAVSFDSRTRTNFNLPINHPTIDSIFSSLSCMSKHMSSIRSMIRFCQPKSKRYFAS